MQKGTGIKRCENHSNQQVAPLLRGASRHSSCWSRLPSGVTVPALRGARLAVRDRAGRGTAPACTGSTLWGSHQGPRLCWCLSLGTVLSHRKDGADTRLCVHEEWAPPLLGPKFKHEKNEAQVGV